MGGPRRRRKSWRLLIAAALFAALALPVIAYAHIERASYWPDPAPDKSIKPATGGKIPNARPLGSALRAKPPGKTRVVCQRNSLALLRKSIANGRAHGYDIRPHDHRSLSRKRAKRLLKINKELRKRCRFHQIQFAVNAAHNNDRVVIMPGLYTEPASRAQPSNDPACDKYEIYNDRGQTGAVSYTYQFHCPNDQNLIAVMGRAPGPGSDPNPPLYDRHGIPNLGPCIRCNLQMEGSGVSADDVIIDAGRVESGDGGPIGAVKDVGLRADRTDGFVLRNVTVRHAKEHGIYVLEADGVLLDRFKSYYSGEYALLTFVEDHNLIQNCETTGGGDAGLYPGASADVGKEHRPGDGGPRFGTEVRFCDVHHNVGGYSGTASNAVWVHDNNFYDNTLGFTTDVATAAGHPGFPQDSDLIENNNFYSNNFDAYGPGSDVEPSVPEPIGTGLWIAGGNDNTVRNNHFWDNWRRGVMLFSVPDSIVCGPAGPPEPQYGCDPSKVSTSFNNQFYGNVMGVAPDGTVAPNGVDFWWDSFPSNTGNCWFKNIAAPGKEIVTDPSPLPNCNDGTDPSQSMGSGDPAHEAELLNCGGGGLLLGSYDPNTCSWFAPPPKPGSGRAARAQAREDGLAGDPQVHKAVCRFYADNGASVCG